MADFKGLIGPEQLSPDVLKAIQLIIDEALKNVVINPPVDPEVPVKEDGNNGEVLKGIVVISKERPENEPDIWFEIVGNPVSNTPLISNKVIVVGSDQIPAERAIGQVIVEIEK